ncbi:hypothetical protein Vadar_018041 [Vaccinium darrowii]|uniref:Uncharacterized protein n=1 Tax=Vaccinium darrowii TaxID=229202 RepID=A0ACB7YFF6_9ERIC|nr:hypothetical protein Vadar_018041 [Vaccinium darrowii]
MDLMQRSLTVERRGQRPPEPRWQRINGRFDRNLDSDPSVSPIFSSTTLPTELPLPGTFPSETSETPMADNESLTMKDLIEMMTDLKATMATMQSDLTTMKGPGHEPFQLEDGHPKEPTTDDVVKEQIRDLDRGESNSAKPKRYGGSGVNPVTSSKNDEVHALDTQVLQSSKGTKPRREFTSLGSMTLTEAMERLNNHANFIQIDSNNFNPENLIPPSFDPEAKVPPLSVFTSENVLKWVLREMEQEEDEECTQEEEEIGDMLLGLTLFGNPDATFGWADAPEFTGEVEDVLNIDDDDYVADDSDNLCYDPDYPYHEDNTLSHPDSEPEEQSLDITINVLDPDFAPNYSTYIAPYNHPVPVSHMLEQPTICTLNAVRAFNCLRLSQPSDDTYSPTRIDNTWFSEEVSHLTRGGRHFKPAFLEGDRPRRTLKEEMERNIGRDKEEEEDDVIQPDGEEPYLTGFHFEDACFLETNLKAYAPPRIATEDVDNPNVLTIMNKMGFFPGMGLGKRHQGIPSFLDIPVNKFTFGFGYKPTEQVIFTESEGSQGESISQKRGKRAAGEKNENSPDEWNMGARGRELPILWIPRAMD